MAEQVKARLSGDDYQHLLSWRYALLLKRPSAQVERVTIEDNDAGSFDDITVEYEPGTKPHAFYQVKYHVNHKHAYSTETLLHKKTDKSTSLLQKFHNTWKKLKQQYPYDSLELHLVSNWTWDSNDPLGECISGKDSSLTPAFLNKGKNSNIGKKRTLWQEHLGCPDEEFKQFTSTLRFLLGYSSATGLEDLTSERMENLGLRFNHSALVRSVGIVREWIKTSTHTLTSIELEKAIQDHDLYLPVETERTAVLYVSTIKGPEQFDLDPDYHLDWRDLFEGSEDKKRHQVLDPNSWNGVMLPELQAMEPRIRQDTKAQLLKARGFSRLSAWFAVGHTFPQVGGYTIEVKQQPVGLWRSDATPSTDFHLTPANDDINGEDLAGKGDTVAVGLSVTGSLEEDVRAHLQQERPDVAAVLFLQPNRPLDFTCLRSADDAVAMATQAKNHMRNFCKQRQAAKLLLFYLGPLSGACFIGHHLNAVCPEIQVMEHQSPGYASSFLLLD
jgi:SMODS-associated and fused to various effectors sensor domain